MKTENLGCSASSCCRIGRGSRSISTMHGSHHRDIARDITSFSHDGSHSLVMSMCLCSTENEKNRRRDMITSLKGRREQMLQSLRRDRSKSSRFSSLLPQPIRQCWMLYPLATEKHGPHCMMYGCNKRMHHIVVPNPSFAHILRSHQGNG